MIPGIEPYYKQIADSMVKALPESWSVAWINATFYTENVQYSGEYLSGGQTKSFPTDIDAERAFRRMRDQFKQANKPLWCRAKFELRPDGKFNINWSYDDCDENGFARFDPTKEADVL